MTLFSDHSYSLAEWRQSGDDSVSSNKHSEHKRRRYDLGPLLSSISDEDCKAHQMNSSTCFSSEVQSMPVTSPLALLFPDCLLCLWSANVYSYAVVADLHYKASEYAGNNRPHTGAYWACVNGWYESNSIAEVAPYLSKEDCVAHFTSNTLCRFNWQRCRPPSLFNANLVSQFVETFPSMNSSCLTSGQFQEDNRTSIHWCHNAFYSFLAIRLAKMHDVPLAKKKQLLLYNILKRHTDSFISQWTQI